MMIRSSFLLSCLVAPALVASPVTLSIQAPNAKKVELRLDARKEPIPMSKSTDGKWTAVLQNLAPQYYNYSFNIDGVPHLDSFNKETNRNTHFPSSLLLVTGPTPMPWEETDVPHGTLHHHFYTSKAVGAKSEYFVYTPPGFSARSTKTYPVLYLLHGWSDDASGWTQVGKAHFILDNLIAQKKVVPMIVVMPLGYGAMSFLENVTAWDKLEKVEENFSRFSNALLQEVKPAVSKQYPISNHRGQNAIAGLSMGGAESIIVGLNHSDKFAYVATFSGAVGYGDKDKFERFFSADKPTWSKALKKNLKLLWISSGKDDFLAEKNRSFVGWMRELGLTPSVFETEGGHHWQLWRENLVALLPLLFR